MWSIFVYFLIFLVPGLFAGLIFDLLCGRTEGCKGGCCRLISSALIFDLLILGINFAGLRFLKGICNFEELCPYLRCLSFISKYVLLCLVVGIVLAIIACLLLHLYNYCWKHCHHGKKNCG